MLVSEFDYALPAELIAQHPAPERSASRLLHVDARGALHDRRFAELPSLVDERDTVVLNDTRVIKARLFGRKPSGGQVELFVERALGRREALALMRAGHAPKAGTTLISIVTGLPFSIKRMPCGSRFVRPSASSILFASSGLNSVYFVAYSAPGK